MQTRAILKSIDASGSAPTGTVQLVDQGSIDLFQDGFCISQSIDASQLAPGAEVIVEINDPFHPGDGQIVSIAGVESIDSAVDPPQSSMAGPIATDGSGNGSIAVAFGATFSVVPRVTVSTLAAVLGSGTISAASVTTSGFTITIAGALPNTSLLVAWKAEDP